MKIKPKIKLNKTKNTLFLGHTYFDDNKKPTGKINIYLKSHMKKNKLDVPELASTVKHELMHFNNPNMTEKEIYKRTAKTKLSNSEMKSLIAKLKIRGITKGEFKDGALISKVNESKQAIKNNNNRKQFSKTRLSIMGLV